MKDKVTIHTLKKLKHAGQKICMVTAYDATFARILDDAALGSRLGSGAQARIADRFSVDRMVSATENLYFDLMARKQVPAVAPAC